MLIQNKYFSARVSRLNAQILTLDVEKERKKLVEQQKTLELGGDIFSLT